MLSGAAGVLTLIEDNVLQFEIQYMALLIQCATIFTLTVHYFANVEASLRERALIAMACKVMGHHL